MFLSQAVEQNNIFFNCLSKVFSQPAQKGGGFLGISDDTCFASKLLVHPRYPGMAGGVDLVHLTRKGAAAAEFLPHSACLFCRTASHTRSTQLSQRVTIFNTIVFMYTQYFCHFYSTIWLHAFKYLSGHLISFEAVRIFLSFGHESRAGTGLQKR